MPNPVRELDCYRVRHFNLDPLVDCITGVFNGFDFALTFLKMYDRKKRALLLINRFCKRWRDANCTVFMQYQPKTVGPWRLQVH
jgi:hypothetical protein